jgi:four helix bundle protein
MKDPPPRTSHPVHGLIPAHGGYRKLKSFQVAQLCFDLTVRFCDRYVDKRDRTHDQMVQAARSGKQNIAEGSKASGTSKKTELKLTNVARASLEELRLDYEDYLRKRGLEQWSRQDSRRDELIAKRCATAEEVADWVRELHGRHGQNGHRFHGAAIPRSVPQERTWLASVTPTKSDRFARGYELSPQRQISQHSPGPTFFHPVRVESSEIGSGIFSVIANLVYALGP